MDYRIFKLNETILANLKQNWTVGNMAESANITDTHFHKLFKKEMKQTPIQFLKELRLKKAKELLQTTNKRVKEIICEVGIYDQTHFVRDFKRKFGLKPNEYRQNYWDKIQAGKRNGEKT